MNPHISWSDGTITIQRDGKTKALPQEEDTQSEQMNFITAKTLQSILRREQSQKAFVGIIRRVDEDGLGESKQKGNPEMEKLLQGNVDPEIQKLLQEYSDIFPEDLPLGVPPKGMGHEF